MPHEVTERDALILGVIEYLGFMPPDELERGVEVYKISEDPTVDLPAVLVGTGRIIRQHMDAIEAVADARLAAEKTISAPHRVTSAVELDAVAAKKEDARQRAALAGAFSARSKEDVRSAWEAHRKKGSEAESAEPEAKTEPRPRLRPLQRPTFERVKRSRARPAAPRQEEPPPNELRKIEPQPIKKPAFERVRRSVPEPKKDVSQGKQFVPSWVKKKGEAPVEEEPVEAEPEVQEEHEDVEKHLQAFVARALRSRLHQQALEELVTNRITVIDSHELAKSLGAKEREVRRALDDWRACGIVKQLGSHPYALSPGSKDLRMIKTFLKLWAQPNWHPKLLRMILAEESKD